MRLDLLGHDHIIPADEVAEFFTRLRPRRIFHLLWHSRYDGQRVMGNFMTDQELNRAVQYVTASTSYGRDTVAEILKTGLSEMTSLAMQSSERFERDVMLEYVCQWTIKRTGQPEPLVREILGCASRWLDEVYEEIAKRQPEVLGLPSDDDDEGAEPV
jgi:hypothetical protein